MVSVTDGWSTNTCWKRLQGGRAGRRRGEVRQCGEMSGRVVPAHQPGAVVACANGCFCCSLRPVDRLPPPPRNHPKPAQATAAAPLQSRVLLYVLSVLVQRGGADAPQLATPAGAGRGRAPQRLSCAAAGRRQLSTSNPAAPRAAVRTALGRPNSRQHGLEQVGGIHGAVALARAHNVVDLCHEW